MDFLISHRYNSLQSIFNTILLKIFVIYCRSRTVALNNIGCPPRKQNSILSSSKWKKMYSITKEFWSEFKKNKRSECKTIPKPDRTNIILSSAKMNNQLIPLMLLFITYTQNAITLFRLNEHAKT